MAAQPLSDELALEAAKALLEAGTKAGAARLLGLPPPTYDSRLKVAARRGMLGIKPGMPGFVITGVSTTQDEDGNVTRTHVQQKPEVETSAFNLPEGHRIKGVSALLDANGNVQQQWVKTREGELDPLYVAGVIKSAFEDFRPAAEPHILEHATDDDLLTLIPCNDWHINLLTWARETGENWDLDIAESTIGAGIEDVVLRSPRAGTAIVLGGGDLLHADNKENRTLRSGNALDVDGRYQKGIEVACRLIVRTVDAALRQNGRVIVRMLPGNHDEHSTVAVTYFLLAWYRNEPRVSVDTDASLFFYHRFGKVMLAATHGHTVKLKEMPSIMAHRRAEDWGATQFRYAHGFHIHHQSQTMTEGGGVICESHQAPIPQDAWHHGAGFLSGRSLQTITYHMDRGEVGRVRISMGLK